MIETSQGESHKGWSIKTRSARAIKARMDYAKTMDDIGQDISEAFDHDYVHKQYRYYAIRYRTDSAYVNAMDNIRTTPWKYRRRRGRIASKPKWPVSEFARSMFESKARTRLARQG